MEEIQKQEVTKKDILKHYLSSILIYGIILVTIIFCPAFNSQINNPICNYITFFLIYYIGYVILAFPIYLLTKPKSILTSRSLTIINYFKRQFDRTQTSEKWLENIEPKENEKQAFVILFMQSFFGLYCVNLLCNKYILSLDYNIGYLGEMFHQAVLYTHSAGIIHGIIQYIDDSADMWLTMITMIITVIFTISYLTEFSFLKNKIKSIDVTPLGILSCIICYQPIRALAQEFIVGYPNNQTPINNLTFRIVLYLLIILVYIINLLAIVRLGTKSGNLTNRGIVTKFPYNIIRHPNYAMEICLIILTSAPIYLMQEFSIFEKILMTLGFILWIFIYYVRAITEERHLIKDPEYKEYVEKVKYRFIPKLF